jgi:hypothetical protein
VFVRRQLLEPRFGARCAKERRDLLDLGRPHALSVARETEGALRTLSK